MPFDPIAPTKTEPSLEGLAAWLETMPPEQEYRFADVHNCALAQYGRFLYGDDFNSAGAEDIALNSKFDRIYVCPNSVVFCKPHTFGAALARTRKLLEAR